jgi:RimJ/RimL family protein N-acetyltransferase
MSGLATPRLTLNALVADDARELAGVLGEPGLYEFTGGSPPSEPELRRLFEAWERRGPPDGSETWLNWTIRLRETGEAIGYVQATLSASMATIAYVVGRSWQRQGFAREATVAVVEDLLGSARVDLLQAWVAPGHEASARVAAAAGLAPTAERSEDGEILWSRVVRTA